MDGKSFVELFFGVALGILGMGGLVLSIQDIQKVLLNLGNVVFFVLSAFLTGLGIAFFNKFLQDEKGRT